MSKGSTFVSLMWMWWGLLLGRSGLIAMTAPNNDLPLILLGVTFLTIAMAILIYAVGAFILSWQAWMARDDDL